MELGLRVASRLRKLSRRHKVSLLQRSKKNIRRRFLTAFLAVSIQTGMQVPVWAQLPTGGDVVAGAADIANAGATANITSQTDRAVINWQAFSVGQGNTVNFNQPSATSAILNRVVTDAMPSIIAGAINSNGNVYLANPSGIVVGPSGMINTNGFMATTFDISTQEFMQGGNLNLTGNSKASVVNQGTINTGAGGANLIAQQVVNSGTITSQGGSINLATGGKVTLSNGATYTQADIKTIANGISETAGLIQNSGAIRATGALNVGGQVYLVNPGGKIINDGSIMAKNVGPASSLSTGGKVVLEGKDIELKSGSTIDASGTHGGGEVLVGGDWQGTGSMTQATAVKMDSGATIDASATVNGDGGKIVLWSDVKDALSTTRAHGILKALGGALGGDGGKIETSGYWLSVSGIIANASAALGKAGTWLLDPYNVTITGAATTTSTASGPPYEFTSGAGGTNVLASDIESQLNGGTSVIVQTSGTAGDGFGDGEITVSANISKTAGGDATLTLLAHDDISIGSGISIGSTTNKLNIVLNSNSDATNGGIIVLGTNATLDSNGGNITLGGGADPLTTPAISEITSQTSGVLLYSGSSILADGGNISIRGQGQAASGNGAPGVDFHAANISTNGSGNITVHGVGGGTNSSSHGVSLLSSNIVGGLSGAVTVTGVGGLARIIHAEVNVVVDCFVQVVS